MRTIDVAAMRRVCEVLQTRHVLCALVTTGTAASCSVAYSLSLPLFQLALSSSFSARKNNWVANCSTVAIGCRTLHSVGLA